MAIGISICDGYRDKCSTAREELGCVDGGHHARQDGGDLLNVSTHCVTPSDSTTGHLCENGTESNDVAHAAVACHSTPDRLHQISVIKIPKTQEQPEEEFSEDDLGRVRYHLATRRFRSGGSSSPRPHRTTEYDFDYNRRHAEQSEAHDCINHRSGSRIRVTKVNVRQGRVNELKRNLTLTR